MEIKEEPARRKRPMLPLCIEYGQNGTFADITIAAIRRCHFDGKILIPAEDVDRDQLFGDPLYGVVKKIIISDDKGKTTYEAGHSINHDVDEKHPFVLAMNSLHSMETNRFNQIIEGLEEDYAMKLLSMIYITPKSNVLQLGVTGNSCLVAFLLEDSLSQLVVLEPNVDAYTDVLHKQRQQFSNKTQFILENRTLATTSILFDHKRQMFVKPGNKKHNSREPTIEDGCEFMQTIKFDAIQAKYNIYFDILIINQKNVFYYYLREDAPNILGSKLLRIILITNDFLEFEQAMYVHNTLKTFGFERALYLANMDVKSKSPLNPNFYECWRR